MIPFREEETGALARAEQLEIENQELRDEIESLKDRIGENRDAYVTNLEGQLAALKSENQSLRSLRGEDLAKRGMFVTFKDASTAIAICISLAVAIVMLLK